MKMWSGRFRQPLDPGFERWQRSFEFDQRLLRYELEASRAHARALKEVGILSSGELIAILQGLEKIGEIQRVVGLAAYDGYVAFVKGECDRSRHLFLCGLDKRV